MKTLLISMFLLLLPSCGAVNSLFADPATGNAIVEGAIGMFEAHELDNQNTVRVLNHPNVKADPELKAMLVAELGHGKNISDAAKIRDQLIQLGEKVAAGAINWKDLYGRLRKTVEGGDGR